MRRSVGFLLRCRARMLVVAVTAMSVGACTSTSQVGQDADVSPPTPPVVGEITFTEPAWSPDGSNWALDLRWDPPMGANVDHFEVWRDGRLMAGQVTGLMWTDPRVQPDRRYIYEVRAVATDAEVIQPESKSITTDSPDDADARLVGLFAVRLQKERSSGIVDPVENGRVVFRFEPTCTDGPCSVEWTVRDHPTEVALTLDGGSYRGEARTPLLIRNCFGEEVDEDVTARFHVAEAEAGPRGWLATEIEGTIRERSSWEGCTEASIRWNVTSVLPSER